MSVEDKRDRSVRDLVRRQIIEAIRHDLPRKRGGEGGEVLMKEVWEELQGDECEVAEDEMQRIMWAIDELPYPR